MPNTKNSPITTIQAMVVMGLRARGWRHIIIPSSETLTSLLQLNDGPSVIVRPEERRVTLVLSDSDMESLTGFPGPADPESRFGEWSQATGIRVGRL